MSLRMGTGMGARGGARGGIERLGVAWHGLAKNEWKGRIGLDVVGWLVCGNIGEYSFLGSSWFLFRACRSDSLGSSYLSGT